MFRGYFFPQVVAKPHIDIVALTIPARFQSLPMVPIQGPGFLVSQQNSNAYSFAGGTTQKTVVSDLYGGGMLALSSRTSQLLNVNGR
jgi:hypothetical protein